MHPGKPIVKLPRQFDLLLEDNNLQYPGRKYIREIDKQVFMNLLLADPTARVRKGRVVKIGKYSKWGLEQFIKKIVEMANAGCQNMKRRRFPEFIEAFRTSTCLLEKYKARLPIELRDPKHYSGVFEMTPQIIYYAKGYWWSVNRNSLGDYNIEIIYEDNQHLMLVPKDHRAAKFLGKHTDWCITTRSGYDEYRSWGGVDSAYQQEKWKKAPNPSHI